MTDNPSSASFEALRARYAASFLRKRQALEQAWAAFAAGGAGARRELEMQLHRLSGSAGAYGFRRLGDQARAADVMLRDQAATPASGAAPAALAQAVHAVLDELAARAAEAAATAGGSVGPLRIVLAGDDPVRARANAARLEAQGCAVRVAGDADILWQTLLVWPCHAIVLDYRLHGETAVDISPRIRREPTFAATALICCMAEPDAAVVDGLLGAGCDAVVDEAKGIEGLLAQVRRQAARSDRSGIDLA